MDRTKAIAKAHALALAAGLLVLESGAFLVDGEADRVALKGEA